MKQNKINSMIWILTMLAVSFIVVSCEPAKPADKTTTDTKITQFETSQGLKKFNSVDELQTFLKNAASNAQNMGGYYGGINVMRDFAMTAESAAPMAKAVASADPGSGGGADEFSTTNIQVAGVDEADFVKNDGKYIYAISQNKLVIVDAFPAENAKVISETKIDGTPRNMLVNKDRLAVFAEGNAEVPVFAQYDFIPRPRYTSRTHVYVYDISDREKPELVKDYNLDGYYAESRMIDNYVYFIVRDNVYYNPPIIGLPMIKEASTTIIKPDIYYFDNPDFNYNFNTVASFDIFSDKDEVNAKTFMMGYSDTIYVSKDNIYITYRKNLPYAYYETHNEGRFFEVVVPLLPSDVQTKINDVKGDNGLNSYQKWDKISTILEEMYNGMGKSERDNLVEDINNAVEEYEVKLQAERSKTVIQKIGISDGSIEYKAKGEVPGYLLNQFSLDEKDNYLRVATTTEIWARKSVMYNNVFVLNDKLETVGKLEALAPDERIYSTRFLGDRLYMVTFKRIDPLFVIDLSEPTKPEVLGELKIPGFSDYLHPYDENHIIGIGKETEGNEWGGISTKGVKLALFDVSDVKNPKQVDKYEIGEAGTDSEALRDHKAFLFDKNKNLLVIPVTEVKGKLEYDARLGYYRQRYWQGAYVFGVTPEGGFEVKGKVTHNEDDELDRYYWWGSPNIVRRSLYMDDVLYTVSENKIKANDLGNIDKEIKEIKLPYEAQNPYPIMYKGVSAPSRGVPESEVVVE